MKMKLLLLIVTVLCLSACSVDPVRMAKAEQAANRSFEGYALSGGDSMATGAYVGNSNLTPADMQAVRQSNEARRPRITTCSPNVDGSITCTSF